MFATAGGSDVGRSETIQFFHGSEVAFWPNAEEHIASVLMTTSLEKGIYIILESTSNGKNNLFYELCNDAIKKLNDFNFIFIPWYWHLDYVIHYTEPWEPSKPWLEYKQEHNLNLNQLRWAYIKNQILCKMSGENNEDGPSLFFKREFPANPNEAFLTTVNDNTLITLESLQQSVINCEDLHNTDIMYSPKFIQFKQKRSIQKNQTIVLGVDIARGGGDLSWIIDRQGEFLGFNLNQKVNINDSMQVAYWISRHIQKIKPSKVFIDAGGLGISVVDRLKELGFIDTVVAVNFASRANNPAKYLNKRAEMWFLLKEFFSKGGYIIDDPLLLKQLSSVRYCYNLKGQLQLEDKKIIKRNLKHSPDGADAAALTFADNNLTTNNFFIHNTNLQYDPFSW